MSDARTGALTLLLSISVLISVPLAAVATSATVIRASGATADLEPANVANGLVTLSRAQVVNGSDYWDTFCANQIPFEACASPIGLAYFSPNGLMILTQEGWSATHYLQSSQFAVVAFNTTTLQNVSYLHLDCQPGFPYYPGVGSTIWIPCFNGSWSHNSVLLGYDGFTGRIAENVTMPIYAYVLSYNPRDEAILADGWTGFASGPDFAEFNTSSPSPQALNVSALQITEAQFGGTTPFAFDPESGQVLFGSSSGALMELDPTSGATQAVAQLASAPFALAVDDPTDQIVVSTYDPSTVDVLNAGTYAVEAEIAIPSCYEGLCAEPNTVNQVVLDPSHGDAYLMATVSEVTLNLSSNAIVGSVVGYGDGPQITAAYSPVSDRIFVTYVVLDMDSPGAMTQLDHGSEVLLTSLFWVPVSLGILVAAIVVGAVCAGVRARGPAVSPREPRPSVPRAETYVPWEYLPPQHP